MRKPTILTPQASEKATPQEVAFAVSENAPALPSQEGCDASESPEKDQNKLDYEALAKTFFEDVCESFPDVPKGIRNDTIFTVCTRYLRYCCDHNEAFMKKVIYPKFSYGLSEREINSIIHSANSRERGLTPLLVKQAVKAQQAMKEERAVSLFEGECQESPYPSMEQCMTFDRILPRLPKWLNTLLKPVPEGYRFCILMAAAPAMMTLATRVRCKLDNKSVSRLNGWTHLDGAPASNKHLMVEPIRALLNPIRENDVLEQQKEDHYLRMLQNCVNKEDQPEKPKVAVRLLPPNTTRVEHIERMRDCEGAHTYTIAEELSSLSLTSRSQYSNREDFMRLMFDNGEAGNRSKSSMSSNCTVPVAWNLTTSSTRDQTLSCWRTPTDGSASRVMFVLMPDNSFAEWPKYREYTEEDRKVIDRAARILMEMHGLILTPRLSTTLKKWFNDNLELCKKDGNATRSQFLKRSIDISFRIAIVLHLAWIAQEIMDEEDCKGVKINVEDTDLNTYRERTSTQNLARFVALYCLDIQYHLWAKKIKALLSRAYQELSEVTTMVNNRLDVCPTQFTLCDLKALFPDMSHDAVKKMLERWKSKGRVSVKTVLNDHTKIYEKKATA